MMEMDLDHFAFHSSLFAQKCRQSQQHNLIKDADYNTRTMNFCYVIHDYTQLITKLLKVCWTSFIWLNVTQHNRDAE